MKEPWIYRFSTGWVGEDLTGSNHFIKVVDKYWKEVMICLEDGVIQWSWAVESKQVYDQRHTLMPKAHVHILTHSHADHQWLYVTSQAVWWFASKVKILCTPITKMQNQVAIPVWFWVQQKELGKAEWLSKTIAHLHREMNKLEWIYNDMELKWCSSAEDYLYYSQSEWWWGREKNRDKTGKSSKNPNLKTLYKRFKENYNSLRNDWIETKWDIIDVIEDKRDHVEKAKEKLSRIALDYFSKGTLEDLQKTLKRFEWIEFNVPRVVSEKPRVQITFKRSGHMLWAAMVLIETDVWTMLYTWDVGRLSWNRFVDGPDLVFKQQLDYILMESTYGDRMHMQSFESWIESIKKYARQHIPWSYSIFANIASRWPETLTAFVEDKIYTNVLWWSNIENIKIWMEHWGPGYDTLRNNQEYFKSWMIDGSIMPPGIYMATAGFLAWPSWEMAKHISQDPRAQIIFTSYVPEAMPWYRLINEGVLHNREDNIKIPFAWKVHHIQWMSWHGDQSDLFWIWKALWMPYTELAHGDWNSKKALQDIMMNTPWRRSTVEIAEWWQWKKVV